MMDKEQKEIELKKLEIEKAKIETEKAKVRADILRTVIIILIAIGTGIGTVLYRKYKTAFINDVFLVVLLTAGIVFGIFAINQWLRLSNKLKELERWKH